MRDRVGRPPEMHGILRETVNERVVHILLECILVTGWFDIAYSFMIGGDENVYEGRGWGKEGGLTCCPYYNRISHSIAFVGNYTSALPSRNMLHLAKRLIECGVIKVGTRVIKGQNW